MTGDDLDEWNAYMAAGRRAHRAYQHHRTAPVNPRCSECGRKRTQHRSGICRSCRAGAGDGL